MKWITGSVLNDQLSCEIFCPIKKKKYLCTVLINITRYNLKYTNVKIMKKWMLFSIIFLLMGTLTVLQITWLEHLQEQNCSSSNSHR